MTEELFRSDAYLRECAAIVTATKSGEIQLDRTVFYPMGGGQPGDEGTLTLENGVTLDVIDTRKGLGKGEILHLVGEDSILPKAGTSIRAKINWKRRYRHMQVHTCLHLLCAAIPFSVTGGQIGDGKGRLDFDVADNPLNKEEISNEVNRLIAEDHKVLTSWMSELELKKKPELIRTMSVKPPSGKGLVRLLNIHSVDLQPCGGTHVARTGEIGKVVVTKIENKGRHNRRVNIKLVEDAD